MKVVPLVLFLLNVVFRCLLFSVGGVGGGDGAVVAVFAVVVVAFFSWWWSFPF